MRIPVPSFHFLSHTLCLLPFVAVLAFVFQSQAWGQLFGRGLEERLQVQLLAGFSGAGPLYQEGMWIPFNLEVENPGEDFIKGRLVIAPHSESTIDDFRIDVPINFAPKQKKIIRTLGRIPDLTEDLNVWFLPGSRDKPVATLGVRAMQEQERLIAILGDSSKSYGWLEEAKEKEDEKNRTLTAQVLSRSDVLPEWVQGYDTVSLLIWDGLKLDPPTPEQAAALSQYVEMGGTVVLALGDRGDRLDLPGWKDLLGSLPTGSHPFPVHAGYRQSESTNQGRIRDEEAHWRPDAAAGMAGPATGAAVLIAEGKFPGTPCLSVEDTALVYRRNIGAGRVFISTLALSDWRMFGDQGLRLWKDLALTLPIHPPAFTKPLAMYNSYLKISLLGKLPGPLFIGCFLGLYTIMVIPVNYFFFRKRKRLELAWLILPPLAILFSFLAYYLGALQQKSGVVERGIMVGFQPQGSRFARCQGMLGVYSPTRRYFPIKTIEGALPVPMVRDYAGTETPRFDLAFLPDPSGGPTRTVVPDLLVYHWAANNFALDGVADLGGPILATAEKRGGDYHLHIDNQSRFEISALQFVARTRWKSVSAIPAGASHEEILSTDSFQTLSAPERTDYYGYGYGYMFGQEVSKSSFNDFLSRYARPHFMYLPSQLSAGGRRYLEDYAPGGTDLDGMFALAEIKEPCFPMGVDTDLYGKEWASFVLLPVAVKGDQSLMVAGAEDWNVRLADFKQNTNPRIQLYISQGNRQGNRRVNLNDPLSTNSPLAFAYCNFPATGTLVYSAWSAARRVRPLAMDLKSPQTVDLASHAGQNSKLPVTWEIQDARTGDWMKVEETFHAGEAEIARFWLGGEGGITLRFRIGEGAAGPTPTPESSFSPPNWGQMNVPLPKLTLEYELRK
jgi:hypothetical protein